MIPKRIATNRLELHILTQPEVGGLQSGNLPAGLTWGSGYSRENLNSRLKQSWMPAAARPGSR